MTVRNIGMEAFYFMSLFGETVGIEQAICGASGRTRTATPCGTGF